MATSNEALVGGAPGETVVKEIPYPELHGDDRVIVRTTAVAVNPADWKHAYAQGDAAIKDCVMGFDYAGVVVETGAEATKFKKGDRIAGVVHGGNTLRNWEGAFQKYSSVKQALAFKIPDNVTDGEATTLSTALIVSALSLYQKFGLSWPPSPVAEPATIFIYGGSTSMAMTGIQFAKISGLRVITTASSDNADYLKSLGADVVLDYKSPSILADIEAALNGEPLRYAWDCHCGDDSTKICLSALEKSPSAQLVALFPNRHGNEENPSAKFDSIISFSAFGATYSMFGKREGVPEDHALAQKMYDYASEALASGTLKPTKVFLDRGGKGLEGVALGLKELEQGRVRGGKLAFSF